MEGRPRPRTRGRSGTLWPLQNGLSGKAGIVFTLCLHRSNLPILQRLCVLRRSVARRLYMPHPAHAPRSDWPVADDIKNFRRHIIRPLKN